MLQLRTTVLLTLLWFGNGIWFENRDCQLLAQPLDSPQLQLPEHFDGLLEIRPLAHWQSQLQMPAWKSLLQQTQLPVLLENAGMPQAIKTGLTPLCHLLQLTEAELLEAVGPADLTFAYSFQQQHIYDPVLVLHFPDHQTARKSAAQLLSNISGNQLFTAETPVTVALTEDLTIKVLLQGQALLCTRTQAQLEAVLKQNPQLGLQQQRARATDPNSPPRAADWGTVSASDQMRLQLKLPENWFEDLAKSQPPDDPGKRFVHDRINRIRHCTLVGNLTDSSLRVRLDLLSAPLKSFRSLMPSGLDKMAENSDEPLLILVGGMLDLESLEIWLTELISEPDSEMRQLHQIVSKLLGTQSPLNDLKTALGEHWQLQLVEQSKVDASFPVALDLIIARSSNSKDAELINSSTWDGLFSQLAGLMVIAGHEADPPVDLSIKRDWDFYQQTAQTYVTGNSFFQIAALVSPLSLQMSWGRQQLAPTEPLHFASDGLLQVNFTRLSQLLKRHHLELAEHISQFTRQEFELTNHRLRRLASLFAPLGELQSQWVIEDEAIRVELELRPAF